MITIKTDKDFKKYLDGNKKFLKKAKRLEYFENCGFCKNVKSGKYCYQCQINDMAGGYNMPDGMSTFNYFEPVNIFARAFRTIQYTVGDAVSKTYYKIKMKFRKPQDGDDGWY